MDDRGKVLYSEKRGTLGIKNRMFIKLYIAVMIPIGILFYFSIRSGDLACFAPTIFLTLILIGTAAILFMRMRKILTIYEKGIQFSDNMIGYVGFDEIREIKFGITKRKLAKYLVIKRNGKKNITIAGNDYRDPWELTDDVEGIREVLMAQWKKIQRK